jgi:hypothetical protein
MPDPESEPENIECYMCSNERVSLLPLRTDERYLVNLDTKRGLEVELLKLPASIRR